MYGTCVKLCLSDIIQNTKTSDICNPCTYSFCNILTRIAWEKVTVNMPLIHSCGRLHSQCIVQVSIVIIPCTVNFVSEWKTKQQKTWVSDSVNYSSAMFCTFAQWMDWHNMWMRQFLTWTKSAVPKFVLICYFIIVRTVLCLCTISEAVNVSTIQHCMHILVYWTTLPRSIIQSGCFNNIIQLP